VAVRQLRVNKFKQELRKFLMENSFYSVEEYIDRNNKFDLGVSH
jgi:23S rRNA G2069 N7-methylase RlmK/C1962 C5-methylase RlmI